MTEKRRTYRAAPAPRRGASPQHGFLASLGRCGGGRVLLLVLILFLAIAPGPSFGADNVLRVSDGTIISFSRMIEEVKKADMVFIGEVHDVPLHHWYEREVIAAFHESDVLLAVGLEMFRADSQSVLDAWVQGSMSERRFMLSYYENWRLPWSTYKNIFWYAREHKLPLIGLNVPDPITKKIAQQGFASLTEQEKKQLPPSISCNVDPKYMAFIRQAYAGHPHQDRAFVNFCEAQMVWDKAMAWRLVDYLNTNKGRTVVVLAGVGHAWKRGIPEQVQLRSKYTTRSILLSVPGQGEVRMVTYKDADFVILE